MNTRQVFHAISVVRPFMTSRQFSVLSFMANVTLGSASSLQKFIEIAQRIEAMPKTYEQDGKGDKSIAYLHYTYDDSHWYITEKDIEGDVKQAYGYAILNGDDELAECGYISIEEIVECGIDLDLSFIPCTLAEIKELRERNNAPS